MKKVLTLIALALFIGGISIDTYAASQDSPVQISLNEDDPKKKEKKAKCESSEKHCKSSEKHCKSSEKHCKSSKKDCASACPSKKKASDCSKSCNKQK